jgi:hypothetical protein
MTIARLLRRHLTYANVVASLALFVALSGGVAFAVSRPGSDGTITGCYAKKKGTLRVVKAASRCTKKEVAISWSQRGPRGQGGDAGASGPQGPKGDTGTQGLKGDAGPRGADGAPGGPATGKAPDSEMLDGLDSTQFLGASGKAADADQLDGLDSADFLATSGKATDAEKLDDLDSNDFFRSDRVASTAGRIDMDMGDPTTTLVASGGITLTARCDDIGGGTAEIRLSVDSDHDGTWAAANSPANTPPATSIDAADGAVNFYSADAGGSNVLSSTNVSVSSADGLTISGLLTVGFAIHGADCTVAGSLLTTPGVF